MKAQDTNKNQEIPSEENKEITQEIKEESQEIRTEETTTIENDASIENSEQPSIEGSSIDKLKEELATWNDKYLRLCSEFDNYKKRTARERMEFVKTAGVDIFLALLPVLDDLDRAVKSMQDANEVAAIKEGVQLIHTKFKNVLQQKGLQEMNASGTIFDSELHDAISNIPAPTEEMKGKVVEELEKGYSLNGKIIRHAKVIVGQ